MKKKAAIALLSCMILLSGCNTTYSGRKGYELHTDNIFKQVENSSCLYYDINTSVVYVIFNEFSGNTGYGYMSPYYANNRKPYLYVDGELKEIE